jgi:uroporphyrinogen III methyltransferase/synthase
MSSTESQPLTGVGVAITRAEVADGPLHRRLSRLGAHPVGWQAIELGPPGDPKPLRRALSELGSFDWLVFASSAGVQAFEKAHTRDVGGRSALIPKVAAVGRATAKVAAAAGIPVALVPERFGAAGLLAAFRTAGGLAGARVLLPSSSIGRSELVAGLEALGARVERIVAYENRPAPLDVGRCRADLAAGRVDVVTFASPSAVAALDAAFGGRLARELDGRAIVSIGPTTSAALATAGLHDAFEATVATLDGLTAATVRAARARRRSP